VAKERIMRTLRETTKKRRLPWLAPGLVGLLAAVLLSTGPALAQRTTATIWGKVVREAAAVKAGTTVVAANIDTGVEARDATSADGSYTLTGMAPGQYLITVTPPGGQAVMRLVSVQVGQTVQLDIDLAREWIDLEGTETIEVIGQLTENKTSEVATNVSQEQIATLPQSSRNFLNFAQLAPGVRPSSDEFKRNVSSGALEARQTNVFIDGISLKNNVIEGGIVGQDSSRGNPFPQNAIAGFRVLTQNYKAEYEQAGSAVISAITRSGSNELHSEVFSTFQNKSMVANDYFAERRGEAKPELSRYQLGGSVSGPIIEDDLFFFLSYEGNYQDRANRVALGTAPPEELSDLGEYEGNFVSPFREHLGFGKLTWNPEPGEIVDLSASLRRETDIRSFGGQTSRESAENVRNNVFTSALRYQHSRDSLVNEFTFQYLDSQFNPTALNPDLVGLEYTGIVRTGGRDTSQDIGQRALTLRNDVSFTELEWFGQHLVKTGVKVSMQGYRVDKSLYGNPLFYYRQERDNGCSFGPEPDGEPQMPSIPCEARFGIGDPLVSVRNNQFGLFAQDDWQVSRKLTLNVGVRWDIETNPINNDFVTPEDVRATAQALAAIVEPLNGSDFFDVDNYLTDGSQRPIFWGAIQPRLGFAYDLHEDQKTVFFGGAGRYYDRQIFSHAADERLRLQYEVRTFRFSDNGRLVNGVQTIPFRPEYLSAEGLNTLIASGTAPAPEIFLLENDTKPVRSDQFSAGVRQQLGPVGTSLTFTHIRSANGLGYYPANRQATGDRPFLPTPGNFGNVLISADDRTSTFTGVYLAAEKPFSDALSRWGIPWGMSLAYTFGFARERGDLFNFDYPTIKDSPIVPTASDERHRVVLSGIVGLPWETVLSTLITVGSGLPFTIQDASDGYGPGEFVLRRNGGRADELFEFAQVDLRLAKELQVHDKQRVSVFAEAFNIFDTKNFGEYNGSIPPPDPADPDGNENFGKPSKLIGSTRSFQVGLAYKF
jgi:outer membrane receptor protein involved in Fe transport